MTKQPSNNPAPERRTLSAAEIDQLRHWEPELLTLPIHAEIEHQMRIGMDGVESTVIVAPRGSGKTYALETLARRIQSEETERAMREPGYAPRQIEVYTTSAARGAKTALTDLLEVITGESLAVSARRTLSPRGLVERIAWELKVKGVHLVCIDEAQLINADNLDQLRQVVDQTAKDEHPFALILAGSEELRKTCVRIRQLGQRFSSLIRMPAMTATEIGPFLCGFHPHLGPLKQEVGKGWKALERDLFIAASGNFRRLGRILANANALALKGRVTIDEEILRAAIEKLAPEV